MTLIINPSKDLTNLRTMTDVLLPTDHEEVVYDRHFAVNNHPSGKTFIVRGHGKDTKHDYTFCYDKIGITAIFGIRPSIRGVYAPLEDGGLPTHVMAKWLLDKYGVAINFNAHLFEITKLSTTQYQLAATEGNPLVEGAVIFDYLHPLERIIKDTVVEWTLEPKTTPTETGFVSILNTDALPSAQKWVCPSLNLGVDPLSGEVCHVHKTASSKQMNRVAMPKGTRDIRVTLRADELVPEEGYQSQCVLAVGGVKGPLIEITKDGLSLRVGEELYYYRHDFTRRTVLDIAIDDTYAIFINQKCVMADIKFTEVRMPVDNFVITDLSESGYKHNHLFYFFGIEVGLLN